jgi:hypothetical protein
VSTLEAEGPCSSPSLLFSYDKEGAVTVAAPWNALSDAIEDSLREISAVIREVSA